MGDVKVGDRVKVARPDIEGVVTYASPYHKLVDVEMHGGSIITTTHIDVVTKLASPPKVGDQISDEAYETLPVGTVLANYSYSDRGHIIRRPDGDWYFTSQDRAYPPRDLNSLRTILFLPES